MPRKVVIWACEFCNVPSSDRLDILEHEEKCIENPANRACETCAKYKLIDKIIRGSASSTDIYTYKCWGCADAFCIKATKCDKWEAKNG